MNLCFVLMQTSKLIICIAIFFINNSHLLDIKVGISYKLHVQSHSFLDRVKVEQF